VAQVVDGHWAIEGSYIRTQDVGYDRLVAIGDLTWTDYEITVPVIVHSVNYDTPWPPLVGLAARWIGHTADGKQPSEQWYPIGGIGGYAWKYDQRLEIWNTSPYVADSSFSLALGVPYIFKFRVESIASGSRYSLKVWAQGQPEPAVWNLVGQEGLTDVQSGSMLLLVHEADVSFGNVTVVKLP
jgi:hypothetical protein